jgi:hypothetical protein
MLTPKLFPEPATKLCGDKCAHASAGPVTEQLAAVSALLLLTERQDRQATDATHDARPTW